MSNYELKDVTKYLYIEVLKNFVRYKTITPGIMNTSQSIVG